MTEKELKNKDSVNVEGLAPILLPAPVALDGHSEKEQSESRPGVESGTAFTEDTLEEHEIPRAYSQCC